MKSSIRYFFNNLVTKIVNSRLRFEKGQAGKVILGRDVEGVKHVSFTGGNGVGRGTVFTGPITVGYGTTISANCYFIGPIEIGHYTQIGASVGMMAKNHPTSLLATYVNSNLFQGRLNDHQEVNKIVIGHDVWIGYGSAILSGVQVGNGAVIGAGSVVTRSVPDYAIVVGNPARILRYRFSQEIINLLNLFPWWNLSPERLEKYEPVFHLDFNREENLKLLQDMIAEFQSEVA